MFCCNCGAALPEHARFCSACGAALASGAQPERQIVAAMPESPAQQAQAVPARKPTNKKKWILLSAAALCALALIGALALYLTVLSTPQWILARAAGRTAQQLSEAFGNSEDFVQTLDTLLQLQQQREYTIKLRTSGSSTYDLGALPSGYYRKMEQEETIHYSAAAQRALFTMSSVQEDSFSESRFSYRVYLDREQAQLFSPDYGDEVLSLPLRALGRELEDSALGAFLLAELPSEGRALVSRLDVNLFADMSLAAFQEAYGEVYEACMEDALQQTHEKIPDARRDTSVYRFAPRMRDVQELLGCYLEFSIDGIFGRGVVEELLALLGEVPDLGVEGLSIALYLGVREGCLTALELRLELDGEEYSVVLELLGEENIFEQLRLSFYQDGRLELELTGGLKATKNGAKLTLRADDERVVLSIDDTQGLITLGTQSRELELLRYGSSGGGAWFSLSTDADEASGSSVLGELFDLTGSVSVHYELLPLQERPQVLDEDAVALLELDEQAFLELFQ